MYLYTPYIFNFFKTMPQNCEVWGEGDPQLKQAFHSLSLSDTQSHFSRLQGNQGKAQNEVCIMSPMVSSKPHHTYQYDCEQ